MKQRNLELVAVQNYQREEIDRISEKLTAARTNERNALALATPAVNIPLPVKTTAKEYTATPARTTTPANTTPSESSRLSERLPDPERFEGSRSDLCRFLS